MVLRQPPSPAEQELWNAVVAGARAADDSDEAGVRAAVGRLSRLPHPWTCRVLEDTAALLVEELDPTGEELWPFLIAPAADLPPPRSDGTHRRSYQLGARRPPAVEVAGPPEQLRRRLLLIHRLADAIQVGVGAFLDVALAENRRREHRAPPGSVPHCRLGS
ncbi:hypothetical protein ACIBPB_12920 [Micromonospora sp. NPDC049836]|uniref:hypothetical protein n=1 Tax=Micromonospora sp. NPDC049836 TaxID=3364274 RepID=UPI0037AF9574